MSDPVAIAIVGACAAIPTSVAAFFSGYFAYKAAVHSKEALVVSKETMRNTNGMKDDLVRLTAEASKAEGVIEGRAEKP